MSSLEGWHWCSFLWWAWLYHTIDMRWIFFDCRFFLLLWKKMQEEGCGEHLRGKYDQYKEMINHFIWWYINKNWQHKTTFFNTSILYIIHISCVHFFLVDFFFASRKSQRTTYRGHTLSLWRLLVSHDDAAAAAAIVVIVIELGRKSGLTIPTELRPT